MKFASYWFAAVLLLALPGFGNGSEKVAAYIDCHPDHFVIYPGGREILLDKNRHPTSAILEMLGNLRTNCPNCYVVAAVRPEAAKSFRDLRYAAEMSGIEVALTPVDTSTDLRDPNIRTSLDARLQPRILKKIPILFECRCDEVYYVDKEGIDANFGKFVDELHAKSPNRPPEKFSEILATFAKKAGTEYYTVDTTTRPGILSLVARPGLPGEDASVVVKTTSRFQQILGNSKSQSKYVGFLVRSDSFKVFRIARKIAEEKGFQTQCELNNLNESIMLGMPDPWIIE